MSACKTTAALLAVAGVMAPMTTMADDAFNFSGYGRIGFHHESDGNRYVAAEGQLAGNAVGRLGNEHFGGEFQFEKHLEGAKQTQWDAVLMIDSWSRQPGSVFTTDSAGNLQRDHVGNSDVYLKKFYVGVSNLFASQPELYLWVGRDFHQRPNHMLSDYFWMYHDGQGAGFKNLQLGSVNLDLSFVAQSDGSNFTGEDDNGHYAVTSKISGFELFGDITLSLLANYGFSDNSKELRGLDDAYQLATVFERKGTQLTLRYAENADNSVYNKTNDLTTLYAALLGNLALGQSSSMDYLLAYHDNDAREQAEDRSNYSVILRPMHEWDQLHSTWLELGYSVVDYDLGEQNTAWKLTLSQNISIAPQFRGRPQLRFYVTTGEADNETSETNRDTFALGAMVEAAW